MKRPRRVLLIDDHPEDRALVVRELRREFGDLQVVEIIAAAAFEEALDRGDFDLAITDFKLNWSDGLQILRQIKVRQPGCPVIMATGAGSEEIAVAAMKAGAEDYLNKSFQYLQSLSQAVRFLLERSQEQQARRKTAARYARLFDLVPVGLYRITLKGKVLNANLALVELLGYRDRKELLAVNSRDFYAQAEDRRRWRLLMERDGVVRNFEVRLRRRDGSIIWVRNNARAIRDEQGRIIWYEGSAEDITARRQMEEELKGSEARYRLLFESNPQPMLVYDLEALAILKVNQAVVEHYGYSREEFLAMTIKDIRPPEDVPSLLKIVAQLTPGLGYSGEWRHRKKSGEIMDVEIVSHGIVFNDRQARLVLVNDITARKRAERDLQETNEFLRSLLQASAAGIIYLDRDGNVRIWNRAATRMFGWDAEEVLGRFPPSVPPEQESEFQRLRERVLQGEVIGLEGQRRKKDGSLIDVSLSLAPVQNAQGKVEGTLAILTDITQRKKAEEALHQKEEQLQQAQKMEAVGRLAGGVAHDFNNLLTAIMGYSELLQMSHLDQEQNRMAEQIMQVSERAAILIRQLLAFSRRQPLRPMPLDLNNVVRDMEKLLPRVIGEDIPLNIVLEPELHLVKADRGQLEQVIVNLAVNARDAMPGGGRLLIKTCMVTLDESQAQDIPEARPGDFVVLEVTDTGLGIEKEIKKRIFEPFFTTKGPGEGTGLGLSTVYGIVKQHEGWINVYSEPGHGTAFKIYLPVVVTPPAEKPRHVLSLPELRGRGERILVVEDEAKVREIATRMLQQKGYEVAAAASVAEAVAIFEKEQGNFQLVFSDVVLSDQSGLQLVEELKKHQPHLRVLLTSGYADQKVQWLLIEKGKYPFLQKPYSLNDLLQTIAAVLKSGD
jgi:PAS domain S-box-containing protein